MSNKSNGTAFEKEFAELLAEKGFWAHCLKDNFNGQPFDVIAAKDGRTYVFDCKKCQYDDFSLYRIEENQLYAMNLWRKCGNGDGIFAVSTPGGIRLLSSFLAKQLIGSGHKHLRGKTLMENTADFEEWVRWK